MEKETLTFHRIASDINGNPRYVVDYSNLLTKYEQGWRLGVDTVYSTAVKRANGIGGRRYNNKRYAFGIVFQSYSVDETAAHISRVTGRSFVAVKG